MEWQEKCDLVFPLLITALHLPYVFLCLKKKSKQVDFFAKVVWKYRIYIFSTSQSVENE